MLVWGMFFVSPVCADGPLAGIEIPSSPNPVGSGARAMGMGGAFIAVADDATAASWNPGGLVQLELPQLSAVVGCVHRTENNHVAGDPVSSGKQLIYDADPNYLSAAKPFAIQGRNMVVSLNYQRLYDFNREWNIEDSTYRQKGALYALGLAYSAEITRRFSIGVTLNYWGNTLSENKWKQTYHVVENYPEDRAIVLKDKTEEYSFSGWNANFGFFWKINEQWRIGGVFKTPFTADIERKIRGEYSTIYADYPESNSSYSINDTSDDELKMPMSYGIGIAYRISDDFTISADIYRTHWNQFELKSYQKNVSPISGRSSDISHIDPTIWFRLGSEYMIEAKEFHVPIRAGVFYDPAPAEGSPDNYYGFSLGTGIACKQRGKKGYSFDVAYQLRFGNNVGSSLFQNIDFSQDIWEHTVYISLIYYF
jgi:long-subunit fatty acid transport protein